MLLASFIISISPLGARGSSRGFQSQLQDEEPPAQHRACPVQGRGSRGRVLEVCVQL